MSTMLGYPTYKEVLVNLINVANQQWVPRPFKPSELVLEQIAYEASSQVATLRVSAPNSRFFKTSRHQYSKWDFAHLFTGIRIPLKIEEGTVVTEVLSTFCQMYNFPLFVPADFQDPSFLTKTVKYDEDAKYVISAPFAITSLGWAGTLRIELDNGALSLADHVTVTKVQFRYPDTPETGKASLRFLTQPIDFTDYAGDLSVVHVGDVLPSALVEEVVQPILDAGSYSGDGRIDAETALHDALTGATITSVTTNEAGDESVMLVTTKANSKFYGMAVFRWSHSQETQ